MVKGGLEKCEEKHRVGGELDISHAQGMNDVQISFATLSWRSEMKKLKSDLFGL